LKFKFSLSFLSILISSDNFSSMSTKFSINLSVHSPLVRIDSNWAPS
jgi:hypothetical protein